MLIMMVAVLAGLALVASTQAASIVGSKHDLTKQSWYSGDGQVCVFCHAPHGASNTLAPLWNHGTTTATFTMYSSPTFQGVIAAQPSGNSKACLSCHDGTVALDTYGGATGSHIVAGSANVGTDLTNDHPVSFTYDAALATADGGLVTPASAALVVTGVPLFYGKLECASCHAVHDPQYGMFLRASNAASALCLKCHSK